MFAACLLLSACGYAVQTSSPVESVSIGRIENRTFEPKLEDRLSDALVSAFLSNGIRIAGASPYTVKGTINDFELKNLAEKGGVAVRYEVVIKGDFFLVNPDGTSRKLRNSGVFIVSFPSEDALERVLALKEEATVRALNDLAEEIAASILYGR